MILNNHRMFLLAWSGNRHEYLSTGNSPPPFQQEQSVGQRSRGLRHARVSSSPGIEYSSTSEPTAVSGTELTAGRQIRQDFGRISLVRSPFLELLWRMSLSSLRSKTQPALNSNFFSKAPTAIKDLKWCLFAAIGVFIFFSPR